MKPDRLMGITVYLLKNGRCSAQQLAKEFEVSPRTIMRDMDLLGQAGIPITSFSGVNGGYQLTEGYVFDRQFASGREFSHIITALKGLSTAYDDASVLRTIDKLQSIAGSEDSRISIDISAAREDIRINGIMKTIEQAICEKRCVRFTYTNSSDKTSQITVEPLRLEYKWYNWYLSAWHAKHNDICMFKLVRMDDIVITDDIFTETHVYSEKTESRSISCVTVEIHCKSRIKSACREYLRGEIIREYENGDFDFRFTVPEHETFWFGVLLSFGSSAYVTAPPEIRRRIADTCREVLVQYEEDNTVRDQ